MFDVPCELDNEFGRMAVFTPVTELPELEEIHVADERRYDDRQRSYTRRPFVRDGGYRRQTPPYPRRQNEAFSQRFPRRQNDAFSQRFSNSSYWEQQSSRGRRDSLWDEDED